jgi:hypothetical protein
VAPALIVSSPLKVRVRERGTALVATDPAGQVVVEGRRGSAAAPYEAVLATAGGEWRVRPASDGAPAQVLGADGDLVAAVTRRALRGTEIVLPGGETIPVFGRSFLGHRCTFGDLASARTPWLFPQRYFTLALGDELLARHDLDLIVALATHLAETHIAASISAAGAAGVGAGASSAAVAG